MIEFVFVQNLDQNLERLGHDLVLVPKGRLEILDFLVQNLLLLRDLGFLLGEPFRELRASRNENVVLGRRE